MSKATVQVQKNDVVTPIAKPVASTSKPVFKVIPRTSWVK